MPTQPIIDVPIDDNILQSTAEFVFKHCIDSGTNHSPDITLSSEALNLSPYFVLLPSPQAVEQFIPELYASIPTKISAIIPPWSGTLKNWAKNFTVNPDLTIKLSPTTHVSYFSLKPCNNTLRCLKKKISGR